MLRPLLVAAILLGPGCLSAVQHSGSVRAADQFLPGATVTAVQGGAKVVVYTDAAGRYTLDLTPGVWEIQIEMFGFQTQRGEVTVGDDAGSKDWTLEMPRLGSAAAPPVVAAAKPAPPSRRSREMATGSARVAFVAAWSRKVAWTTRPVTAANRAQVSASFRRLRNGGGSGVQSGYGRPGS